MGDLPEWSQWLAAVSASLIAFGVIWRKGLRPAARLIREFVHAADNVAQHGPTLLEIAAEFRPNSGGSLRDVIDRIEAAATDMQGQVVALTANVQMHIDDDRAAFERIEGRLADELRIVKP